MLQFVWVQRALQIGMVKSYIGRETFCGDNKSFLQQFDLQLLRHLNVRPGIDVDCLEELSGKLNSKFHQNIPRIQKLQKMSGQEQILWMIKKHKTIWATKMKEQKIRDLVIHQILNILYLLYKVTNLTFELNQLYTISRQFLLLNRFN
ncbi:unnamed protein product [Paramecium sonneborni]|uniref:Uncharacterized protein n=1 Tax=Paramecium sonneborni TaxID=65129 RepID=A0A8S1RQB8_9CILI|nr:unnamed protein product [Paramecium sonneborni]